MKTIQFYDIIAGPAITKYGTVHSTESRWPSQRKEEKNAGMMTWKAGVNVAIPLLRLYV
jgi:hypothetical protein